MQRRKFLTNTIRGSIIGGLGIITGTLFLKKKTPSCDYIYLCKGCNKVADCQLDEAIRYRKDRSQTHVKTGL